MGPSVGDARANLGIIMESWRLWEGVQERSGLVTSRVADWRLDSDYFLVGPAPEVLVIIAQGASIAADAVERLAGSGCTRVIRFGTCGGLQHSQQLGDFVVVRAAVRDEGTSGHYLPPGFPASADPVLLNDLLKILRGISSEIRPELAWSTDGRWTESDEAISTYSDLGVAAVDMESAGLFAAATRRKLACASISVIADKPIEHIGALFKGLPPGQAEWNLVVEAIVRAFTAILAQRYQWE